MLVVFNIWCILCDRFCNFLLLLNLSSPPRRRSGIVGERRSGNDTGRSTAAGWPCTALWRRCGWFWRDCRALCGEKCGWYSRVSLESVFSSNFTVLSNLSEEKPTMWGRSGLIYIVTKSIRLSLNWRDEKLNLTRPNKAWISYYTSLLIHTVPNVSDCHTFGDTWSLT